MNRFFDIARFGRLLRAHWAESWREYAWFAGVAAMLDLIFIVIFLNATPRGSYSAFQFNGQAASYLCGLFIFGIIFAGRHFRQLANPGSALITLMRPVSLFEKWLLAFLFVSIFFPLAYTLGYSILNFPVVQLAKALYVPDECKSCSLSLPDFTFYVPFVTTGISKAGADNAQAFFKIQAFWLLLLWTMQALVLGGTVFFKRSPVLRTVLTLFLLSVLLMSLDAMPKMDPFWLQANDGAASHNAIESWLSLAQWVGLPLLLWVATFFHLKEREMS